MPNTFLRVWLILWVVFLPLVHVHPEADHAHGMVGHVHGGAYHTVLSHTPICAYEDHQHHHGSFSPGEPLGTSDSPIHASHGLEHSTYSFSVLNSSIDPILEGCVSDSTGDGIVASETKGPVLSVVSRTVISPSKTPFVILTKPLSPRGPPILLV